MINACAGHPNKFIVLFSVMCTTCSYVYSPRKQSQRILKGIYQETGNTTQHSDSTIVHSDNSALYANPSSNNLAINNSPDADDVLLAAQDPIEVSNSVSTCVPSTTAQSISLPTQIQSSATQTSLSPVPPHIRDHVMSSQNFLLCCPKPCFQLAGNQK